MTPDLVGPVKNGSIGTACANLAFALADAGNAVSILFTGLMPAGGLDWQPAYEKRGIRVTTLDTDYDETAFWPAVPQAVYSKRIYDWLREQEDFDLVLFMDCQANEFYSVHAKKTGQYFSNTQLVVALLSPSMWHALHNGYLTGEILFMAHGKAMC